ncbi:MAG: helix-turn-helix domain-containing protein [Hamadaea sp.]|uniref:helix-turn-helix transcriptional regulator n=1 Tax=Hamadaea sp. NPDC050747 TaxID=3155789 RepID=UPI0018269FDB|nr:helix-turn-helix domain-containing protein [Hamadaea sp.]NUR51337.1 helix-turn-helix domain-containing protein [Hamadaea sp.]NUT06901.1 helix-turn-helix domain-containing protein [Hamadaea sp.]
MNQGREEQRRQALGEFIRSRRERTTPEMVGLPDGLRRRTPGLRREEVAMLSGIGVTWYTWLEQGRPINVSTQVLGAVARVLRMDDAERQHLFTLAELNEPHPATREPKVGRAVELMLSQVDPYPAVVVGPRWEILASNHSYMAMFGDYRSLPDEYQNSLLLFFANPRMRTIIGGWAETAPRLVAKMRVAMAADVADPGWQRLVKLVEAHSPEFAEIWRRQEVASLDGVLKTLRHDEAGTIRAEVVHSYLGDQRKVRFSVYTPMDDDAQRAMEKLASVTPEEIVLPKFQELALV